MKNKKLRRVSGGLSIGSDIESGGGVRIEDDVVVTETGCVNLTSRLPRTTEDIEKFMRK